MKVIFLDIDGVLNGFSTTKETTPEGYLFVEDKLVARLQKIIELTGAQVVLSSSWRLEAKEFTGKEADGENLTLLKEKLAEFGIFIIGMTCNRGAYRGWQIRRYLKDHPEIDKWIVLDDMPIYEFQEHINTKYVIQTFCNNGISDLEVEYAIELLNKE